jgi:hypothetical protein
MDLVKELLVREEEDDGGFVWGGGGNPPEKAKWLATMKIHTMHGVFPSSLYADMRYRRNTPKRWHGEELRTIC